MIRLESHAAGWTVYVDGNIVHTAQTFGQAIAWMLDCLDGMDGTDLDLSGSGLVPIDELLGD